MGKEYVLLQVLVKGLPVVLNDPIFQIKTTMKSLSGSPELTFKYQLIPTEWNTAMSCRVSANGLRQPTAAERIRPGADGFIWLALSVQRPVRHNKPQTTNPFKNVLNIYHKFYHSQQLKTDWRQWQNDFYTGQKCDRVSLFRKARFTARWGDYCCGFHNPNRIFADSRIWSIWYKMLAAISLRGQRIQ